MLNHIEVFACLSFLHIPLYFSRWLTFPHTMRLGLANTESGKNMSFLTSWPFIILQILLWEKRSCSFWLNSCSFNQLLWEGPWCTHPSLVLVTKELWHSEGWQSIAGSSDVVKGELVWPLGQTSCVEGHWLWECLFLIPNLLAQAIYMPKGAEGI